MIAGGAPGRASWAGTGALTVASMLGVVAIDTFAPLVVWLSVGLFAIGCVLFFVAYSIAVGRSRTEAIGVGGVYFLAGSAPRRVRRSLMGSLVAQCLIAVAVIVLAPFTSLVMVSMAPMFGVGCAGLWGARHGTFPPRRARSGASPDETS
ncbi:MAG: hypothetical protein U5K29_00930 [Acidimicrobiales bacterium]|nr:hypothetical protein [Acidimicrobiales bacterium]